MTERAGLALVDVLLVEDDPGDVLMTREAFEHYRIPNSLSRRGRRRAGARTSCARPATTRTRRRPA